MGGDERGMVFSPSGDRIYILMGIGLIVSFDAATWEPLAVYPSGVTPGSGYSSYGDGLQISADGRYLSVLGTGNVTLIDLHSVLPVGTNGNDTISESGTRD